MEQNYAKNDCFDEKEIDDSEARKFDQTGFCTMIGFKDLGV